MKQHMHLTYLQRIHRSARPSVAPGTTLPPRELFEGMPEVLTAYDAFKRADDARAKHAAEYLRLHRAADDAERVTYPAAVREAIREGKDATKVDNPVAMLRAQSAGHDELAAEAKREALAIGMTLGAAIAERAPDLYEPLEQQLTTAAAAIRVALDDLRAAWSTWASAWKLRAALAWLRLYGGNLPGYVASVPLDAAVRAAIDTMTTKLNDLPTLVAEEAHVAQWRAEQDAANETNRRNAEANAAQATAARARLRQ